MVEPRVGDVVGVPFVAEKTVSLTLTKIFSDTDMVYGKINNPDSMYRYMEPKQKFCTLLHRPFQVGDEVENGFWINDNSAWYPKGCPRFNVLHAGKIIEVHEGNGYIIQLENINGIKTTYASAESETRHKNPAWRDHPEWKHT